MNSPEERLAAVRHRVAEAARASGRTPDAIRLIAISKQKSLAAIEQLAAAGQVDFGENRMQEALDKIGQCSLPGIRWHFIGHVQTNKTRYIPGHFDWVHSIDSDRLVRRIAESATVSGHTVRLLIQVNVAEDPAKHGVHRNEVLRLIERVLEQDYSAVQLRGLMTIGLRGAGEADTRRTFSALRILLEQCRLRFGEGLNELSMGMSGDYELAIREGATMVRVGTALFGERS